MSEKPLWQCPACGHRFVTTNLWHSCGNHSLDEHFEKNDPNVRLVFDAVVAAAQACGPVTVYAQKTRIVLQRRVRFASVVTRKRWLVLGIWLRHRVEHPTLAGYEEIGHHGFYPKFKLTSPEQLDDALRALIREAYAA